MEGAALGSVLGFLCIRLWLGAVCVGGGWNGEGGREKRKGGKERERGLPGDRGLGPLAGTGASGHWPLEGG